MKHALGALRALQMSAKKESFSKPEQATVCELLPTQNENFLSGEK